MTREFRRIVPEQLARARAEGWTLAGVDYYSEGHGTALLVERPAPEPIPDHVKPVTWLRVAGLGFDELRVLHRVIERMQHGRKQYGALDIAGSSKDWRAEATEEFLDGAIYLAMQSIREKG